MKNLVVIPARGGSKRIPRKNIKDFYGKPIIEYSLRSSSSAGVFDKIHVSTEDQEIYQIVSNLGFKPEFLRDEATASDNAPVRDVLIETMLKFDELGERFDLICLLSATVPLITGKDLEIACNQFIKSRMHAPMLAVTRYPVAIEWALKFNDQDNIVEPLNSDLFFKSSHDFKDRYFDAGSFAIFTRDQLLSKSADIKFIPYILEQTKSVDLDNMDDWNTLEKLYMAYQYQR